MAFAPIVPIAPITSALPLAPTERTAPTSTGGVVGSFAQALSRVDAAQDVADTRAVEAATGDLESVSAYMVAANEAQLMTELTVAVRDRAVEAFNDIMRMQI